MKTARWLAGAVLAVCIVLCGLSFTAAQNASSLGAGKQKLSGYLRPEFAKARLKGALNSETVLNLAISLPVRGQAALDALAHAVSDPQSPNFRKFLKPEETVQRFSPTVSDYDALMRFAQKEGFKIVRTSANRYVLEVSGTAEVVQKAFHVTLNQYFRPDGTVFFAPDREPSLDLDVPLLYIAGLENYFLPRPLQSPTEYDGSLDGLLGPTDFRSRYAGNMNLTGKGQTIGLLEFVPPCPTDITGYANALYASYSWTPPSGISSWPPKLQYWPPSSAPTSQMNTCFTGQATTSKILVEEADLDVEMAMAIAPGVDSVTIYSAGTFTSTGNFATDVTTQAANMDGALNAIAYPPTGYPLPLQVSASEEWEADPLTQQILNTMAAQGQSFFAPSGDGGSYGASGAGCPVAYTAPVATFPSGNPFPVPTTPSVTTVIGMYGVTVVGGTLWAAGPSGEIAWNGSISWADNCTQGMPCSSASGGGILNGGGITAGIPIPIYQLAAVRGANGASNTWRNLPDVSAAAGDVVIYTGGSLGSAGGTSAATPLWAGFIALVNEARQQSGGAGMGFLNPVLYLPDLRQYFWDVTSGNNGTTYVNNGTLETCAGFNAGPGYDLVTGLGTPTGSLINALICSPGNYVNPSSGKCEARVACPVGDTWNPTNNTCAPMECPKVCHYGCYLPTPFGQQCKPEPGP